MKRRIAVVGAGVSGLAAAYRLSCSGKDLDLTLWDAGRPGGTIETEHAEGFLLEKGPDAFITDKPRGLELARELGLEDQIIGTNPAFRRSFIGRGGRLIPVPEGFYLTAPLKVGPFLASSIVSWPGKFRMMAEPLLPKKSGEEDESLASFVRRRFGREALERVAQPMMGGIYTGDPERLSLKATMPRFRELESRYGSVTRGLLAGMARRADAASGPRYGLFASFKGGMQTLTDALVSRLPAGTTKSGRVQKISREGGEWRLDLEGGARETYDAVCLAVPAPAAANLLPLERELADLLSRIEYESVVTLNLGYRRDQVRDPLDGFGFVVPKTEGGVVIAASFSSRKFEGRAPEGSVLLRAFVGGAFGRAHVQKSDAELLAAAAGELGRYVGASGKPFLSRVRRHPGAMVQYCIGHLELVAEIRQRVSRIPGLALTGAAYGGPGIPDCVKDAENAAQNILKFLEER